ncbi:MAG TPA: GAF domain-containing protein [Candidatus Limnocylindrales bacterium]|nr:GAF domain-containing protein [Candidatus Limnocylindrales bacterium]
MPDASDLLASDDVAPLLARAVEEAARLLHADGGMVYLVDEASGDLRFSHDAGITDRRRRDWVRNLRLPVGAGMFGQAFLERRVQLTGDYPADHRFPHTSDADRVVSDVGIRSMVVAPLLDGSEALGALGAFASRPDAFGEADVALVRALAEHAAGAIANRRLIDRLARSETELERRADAERTVREIGARITSTRDVDEVIQLTIDEAVRLLNGEGSRIDVVDPRSGLLRGLYITGDRAPSPDMWPETPDEKPDDGVSGQAVSRNAVIRTGDYLADQTFPHASGPDAYIRATGIRSVIAAPMPGETGPVGALTVYTSRPDAFDEVDERTLAGLAEQASIALTNARLIAELASSREELLRRASAEHALREIAEALAAMPESGAVLQRVADETGRLVRADGTILSLLDPGTGLLHWAYDDGLRAAFDPGYVANLTLPLGVGPTGIAVAEARVVRVDRDLIDQFPPSPENDTFFGTTHFRSIVAVPIVAEAGPIGALEVYSTREAAFSPADEALLGALAGQAAVALTNARLIEELRRSREENARRAEREQSLREIAARVTAIREPGVVLERVVREARRLLGAKGAVIDLVDPASGAFRRAYDDGVDAAARDEWVRLDIGRDIVRDVIRGRAVALSDDYLAQVATPAQAAFVERSGVRSLAVAPLVAESRALGTLGVFSDETGRWTPDDANLLAALADQAAIAMTNARLIEELERSRTSLRRSVEAERALREIAARITALREPDEVLEQIVEEASRLLGSDGGHLTLLGDDRRFLEPVVVLGAVGPETEAWVRSRRFPVGTGINGLAAGENRVTWTFDYPIDPRIGEEPAQGFASRLGIRAMAAAPLRAPGGEVIGTLAISYREPREFQPEEAALLQGLADHAAIAVANSRLLEQLQASESAYRHLVQNSPDLVWAIDSDARFTFLSDTCERLTGWRPEQLLGRHFGELVHPNSRDVAERDWLAGQADGAQELRGRLDILHRDGHAVPAEFIAQSRAEDGRFVGANGSVRDMTERDRLERQLRASEERHRFLVTASPDLTWEVDADGVFTFVSDRIAELTGNRPDEVVGHHFDDLLHDDTRQEAYARYSDLVREPGVVHPARFSLRHRDGHAVPIENFAVGIVRDGAFVGAHGAARDVSERDRLEHGLRRQAAELAASEERAHLARELHDSVTQALFSMTLITRTIELLIGRDPDAAREKLAALRDLQRDALAEMRSLIFELRPGSLEQDGLVHALRTHSAAVEGRIGLPIQLDAEPLERLPIEIEDVVYRIAQEGLHNIVKHASARQVRIALRRVEDRVRLSIEDDGKGFDPAAIPPGHLGVAGMRARAERIGGRLTVRSSIGSGTRIELDAPACERPNDVVRS